VKRIFFMMILSLISAEVFCAPKVIATLGPTVPISLFLKSIDSAKHPKQPTLPNNKMASMNLSVHTKGLSPGIVQPRDIKAPLLAQPIYIVGNDDLSKTWLKKYASRLKSIHAVGFIVNVDSNKDVQALEKRFDLTLIPINGTALMKRFNLTHYPVLISQHRIEQ